MGRTKFFSAKERQQLDTWSYGKSSILNSGTRFLKWNMNVYVRLYWQALSNANFAKLDKENAPAYRIRRSIAKVQSFLDRWNAEVKFREMNGK